MAKMTEEQNLDTIGKRISACMKKHGISMRALSRKVSISQPSVFKWTHDELTPKIEQIEEMATIFDVTPEWLAFGCIAPQVKTDDGMQDVAGGEASSFSFRISDEAARTRFGVESRNLLLLQVQSDEMSPSLNLGDIAIVNRAVTSVNESGIYVLRAGGVYALRRVQRLINGKLCITCDNGKYQKAETLNDAEELHVIGKVISKLSLSMLN